MDKSMKMFLYDPFCTLNTSNPILFNCVPYVMRKAVGLEIGNLEREREGEEGDKWPSFSPNNKIYTPIWGDRFCQNLHDALLCIVLVSLRSPLLPLRLHPSRADEFVQSIQI